MGGGSVSVLSWASATHYVPTPSCPPRRMLHNLRGPRSLKIKAEKKILTKVSETSRPVDFCHFLETGSNVSQTGLKTTWTEDDLELQTLLPHFQKTEVTGMRVPPCLGYMVLRKEEPKTVHVRHSLNQHNCRLRPHLTFYYNLR